MTAPAAASVDDSHDVQAGCRFYVEIDQEFKAVFTEISGLQAETTLTPYEEGGNNAVVHQLPGRTKFSNVTLKRGVTRSNDFFKWYMDITLGNIKRRNISIVLYNSLGEALLRWNLIEAFPVRWIGPQFTADGRTVAIESIELTFTQLQVV